MVFAQDWSWPFPQKDDHDDNETSLAAMDFFFMRENFAANSLRLRYLWVLKFPLVLLMTVYFKLRNRGLCSQDNYGDHLREIYGKKLFSDQSDKFSRIRGKIARLAFEKAGTRALDLATGAGWQAVALKKVGFSEVVGIDLVPERIAFCHRLHRKTGVDFLVMDGANLVFPDNYFDSSTVSGALHDMPREVKKRVLAELARVTKYRIIIFEPRTFKHPLLAFFYGLVGELVDESLHFKEYARDDLQALLAENQLEVVQTQAVWHGLMDLTVCRPTQGKN